MKKLLMFAMLALCGAAAYAQSADMKFETEKHDFGKINETDGEARVVFKFTNQGDVPLIIQDVQASCDCTSPDWTQEPVMPGKQGSVTVVYDTKGRPGVFDKTINVYNNGKTPFVTLRITGEVIGGLVQLPDNAYVYEIPGTTLRMDTKHISLGQLSAGQTASARVNLINTGQKDVRIAVDRTPKHLEVMATPTTIKPGKVGRINIVYDASKKEGKGFQADQITYTVDSVRNDAFKIAVTAEL
ncbi:MAG: DUF1573 domain-containing protein [Bacteroidales bacterium]|nr:DUF1573 domain-containing protein [Bacteroidales bacterium]MBR3287468.1 DUF1573 domain-containing protein [Bacteroidales bacterium]MCR5713462.1 DUF1573 domain-containing protein [Bacteroidales bacterium]